MLCYNCLRLEVAVTYTFSLLTVLKLWCGGFSEESNLEFSREKCDVVDCLKVRVAN